MAASPSLSPTALLSPRGRIYVSEAGRVNTGSLTAGEGTARPAPPRSLNKHGRDFTRHARAPWKPALGATAVNC